MKKNQVCLDPVEQCKDSKGKVVIIEPFNNERGCYVKCDKCGRNPQAWDVVSNSKSMFGCTGGDGGKKSRRKTSKKSHRKTSKKQRKSRRARKSRRGRR